MITLEVLTKYANNFEKGDMSCIVMLVNSNDDNIQASIFVTDNIMNGPESFEFKYHVDYTDYLKYFIQCIKEGYQYKCAFNLNDKQILCNMYNSIIEYCK